jgi:hypothetical protein
MDMAFVIHDASDSLALAGQDHPVFDKTRDVNFNSEGCL